MAGGRGWPSETGCIAAIAQTCLPTLRPPSLPSFYPSSCYYYFSYYSYIASSSSSSHSSFHLPFIIIAIIIIRFADGCAQTCSLFRRSTLAPCLPLLPSQAPLPCLISFPLSRSNLHPHPPLTPSLLHAHTHAHTHTHSHYHSQRYANVPSTSFLLLLLSNNPHPNYYQHTKQ